MYVVEKNVPVIPHIRGRKPGSEGAKSPFRKQLEKLKINESFSFTVRSSKAYLSANRAATNVRSDLGHNIILRTESRVGKVRTMRAYRLPAVKAKNALVK